MWVHWAVFFAILSVAWPLNSTELQLSCSHPAEQLVKTLRSFRHAALLARTNVHAAPAHTCGAWKGRGKKLPGCAFTPANHTVKWFFDTPLTQQFSNPNYRPVVTPENHPRYFPLPLLGPGSATGSAPLVRQRIRQIGCV